MRGNERNDESGTEVKVTSNEKYLPLDSISEPKVLSCLHYQQPALLQINFAQLPLLSLQVGGLPAHKVKETSFEAFEGKLTVNQLEEKVDRDSIKRKALSLLECN